MIQINLDASTALTIMIMWQPIHTAVFGVDLQLAVIERGEVHELIFPCRRDEAGWLDAKTSERIAVSPTHWRMWDDKFSPV